jgi:hypothetical protein
LPTWHTTTEPAAELPAGRPADMSGPGRGMPYPDCDLCSAAARVSASHTAAIPTRHTAAIPTTISAAAYSTYEWDTAATTAPISAAGWRGWRRWRRPTTNTSPTESDTAGAAIARFVW